MNRPRLAPLARAIGGMVLAVAALLPAGAATVAFDFVGTVSAGPFAGQHGNGSIQFDDAVVDGEVSPLFGDLAITFTFRGQSFDQTNDADHPDFPTVQVSGGVPVLINFLLEDGFSNVDFIDDDIGLIALQGPLQPGVTSRLVLEIDVVLDGPVEVPEPATFGLAGLALLGLLMGRRRVKAA